METYLYKWTDRDTERLIRWRGANEALFTGRRSAAVRGFEAFIIDQGLEGKVETGFVKKKWENLKQKYKERSTATAANWKWFGAMEEVLGDMPSMTPPLFITSSMTPPAVGASPPSPRPQASTSAGSRGEQEGWVTLLQELDKREAQAEERAERREREMQEREIELERERREDERRWLEKREREWRDWIDVRMREERQEREREYQAREDKLMSILEKFLEK
ncbi:uncharacterized protein PAE49_000988 [Odontesthes bonariensis]|uniref:uncharacterized protein LOC142373697 n=1 Tax=Odontesthes bonariensis TaxID=219752 RepID=UPI003F582AA8